MGEGKFCNKLKDISKNYLIFINKNDIIYYYNGVVY